MITIFRELKDSFEVLFPGGRFRYVLIVLSMLGAIISISELLVLRFFIKIVDAEGQLEKERFIALGIGLGIFYALMRLSQYFQRVYRVTAFKRAFKSLKKIKDKDAKNPEWAMAFEISSLLTNATQLLAVLVFIFILEPYFALLNLVVLVAVIAYLGRLLKGQLRLQIKFKEKKKLSGKAAAPHQGYSSRIRAAETGALVASGGMVILLGALLIFSYSGEITVANTLIIFFATRLQNGSLTSGSRSLMRYAKAKAGAKVRDDDEDE
ncbi:MAG: hypothetical protein FJW46_02770 [Actinobacteria bacterium]|nr:hypothetical protein [Actinomycetota bacterium]